MYLLCAKNCAKDLIGNKIECVPVPKTVPSPQGSQTLKGDTALQSVSCSDGVSDAIQRHKELEQSNTLIFFKLSAFI